MRMAENEMSRKVMTARFVENRKAIRWTDEVYNDAKLFGLKTGCVEWKGGFELVMTYGVTDEIIVKSKNYSLLSWSLSFFHYYIMLI